MAKFDKKINEPSILVKPVSKFGGLDNIHLALIVLVVVLILLLVAVSYTTKITVINETLNGTGNFTTVHNASQIKLQAEKILAGYGAVNNSASILPYISNVNNANISYLAASKQWYVTFPYSSPINHKTYLLGILINDLNTSHFSTFVQQVSSPNISDNYVIAPGVIKLAGQTSCLGSATQIYWFIDPYAPGAVPSLINETNLQSKFGNKANVSLKILYTQYSNNTAKAYGINGTLALGSYIECGVNQKNFTGFVRALNASYNGAYMPLSVLSGIASASGFNSSSLNSCIQAASSYGVRQVQTIQAKRFNVTAPVAVVTDCQYLSIPQTESEAACFANKALC